MINLTMLEQPDDFTCGPTSLHSVYNYFNYHVALDRLIKDVHFLEDGGTLAVYLGIDAIKRGFKAQIYTYNLRIFDPTWATLSKKDLITKLEDQLSYKKSKKLQEATKAYISFTKMGGKLLFDNLTITLLKKFFNQKIPVLAGLSATYLYRSKREYTDHRNLSILDDLRGEPMGHFVVLCGMRKKNVIVADPYKQNPISEVHIYEVEKDRLINSILLGIVTYDANLLVISPT